jgi:hypothetical protein
MHEQCIVAVSVPLSLEQGSPAHDTACCDAVYATQNARSDASSPSLPLTSVFCEQLGLLLREQLILVVPQR